MKISYLIPLKPIAWSRTGHNRKTNVFYDKQKDIKTVFGYYIKKCHGSNLLFDSAVEINACFYFKNRVKNPRKYHTIKPDIDNLEKLLYDICKSLCFTDDCLIVSNSSKKLFSDDERIEFTIQTLD